MKKQSYRRNNTTVTTCNISCSTLRMLREKHKKYPKRFKLKGFSEKVVFLVGKSTYDMDGIEIVFKGEEKAAL